MVAMETLLLPACRRALAEDAFEMPGEEFFEFGLQRLLDGIAVLVESR